jgi:hypothetical protein
MEITIPDNMTIIIIRSFSSIICRMVIPDVPFTALALPTPSPPSMA